MWWRVTQKLASLLVLNSQSQKQSWIVWESRNLDNRKQREWNTLWYKQTLTCRFKQSDILHLSSILQRWFLPAYKINACSIYDCGDEEETKSFLTILSRNKPYFNLGIICIDLETLVSYQMTQNLEPCFSHSLLQAEFLYMSLNAFQIHAFKMV